MHIVRRCRRLSVLALGALAAGCATPEGDIGTPDGGSSATGGKASGGAMGSGGVTVPGGSGGQGSGGNGSGGTVSSGGTMGSGGKGSGGNGSGGNGSGGRGGSVGSGGASSGGAVGSGGSVSTGGTVATGGSVGGGGRGSGGSVGSGGTTTGPGGRGAGGRGATATGGAPGSGGSGSGNTGGTVDPCTQTTPLTGGTPHASSNASGTAAGLSWTIWSNGSGGSITTYAVPAFSATWKESGDFLARLGLQWNATKTFDQYGTITAQFASKKTGTAGGYSYIGIYGWSVSPCVEFYIVDDSYNQMPVNPGNTTNKGTATIDGGMYTLYTRATTGTGGSKCSGVSNWAQYYSVRHTARMCGQISITEHFKAWASAGMPLGKMDQAQILVEVGAGTGSIDFTVANVTAQ